MMLDARMLDHGLPVLTGKSRTDRRIIRDTFTDLLSATYDALNEENPDMTGPIVAQIVAENLGLRWRESRTEAGEVEVMLTKPPKKRWWRRGKLRWAFWWHDQVIIIPNDYGDPERKLLGRPVDPKWCMVFDVVWM